MASTSASPDASLLPAELQGPLGVLMIDNFDSFTWNLYQQLCLLGAKVTVIRNDTIPASALPLLNIEHLIISPGPGHPRTDSGISRDAIKHFAGKVPVLGVCMGLECLVDVYGGEIAFAGEIMHGKLSRVRHDDTGCFRGVPQGVQSTRYHSLSAAVKTLPPQLQITAVTADSGVIMGVRHRELTVEAVQYHPESILSEGGDDLMRNFLGLKGGRWEENPQVGVKPDAPAFLPDGPDHAHPTGSAPAVNGQATTDGTTSKDKGKVPTILEKIYSQRLKDVELAKVTPGTSPSDLATLLSMHLAPPLIPVLSRVQQKTPALMAEIKRASPSKGDIAPGANAAQQALTYALAGASVVSVLTEPTWFKGSLLDMRLARQAVDKLPNRPAILRKDFVLDEYQIAEARLNGADTVLLIVAMLAPERLKALYAYSLALGMEPLVEVNNAQEMEAALALGSKLIGVNNRNLHDFTVDMGTTSRLVDMVKGKGVILCALSGIASSKDVHNYVEQGVGAVLVGESLMRASNTRAFIRELLDWAEPKVEQERKTVVKICGIRSVEDAMTAADAGADMLGLVFVPSSKRHVSSDMAKQVSTAIRSRRAASTSSSSSTSPLVENDPWFSLHAKRLQHTLDVGGAPLLVGVFQNQSLAEVLDAVATAQLDLVQLHGNEPDAWTQFIPVPVIRAFHVDARGRGVAELTRPGVHQFVLLDSVRSDVKVAEGEKGLSGGSGQVVDWDLAASLVGLGELSVNTHSTNATSAAQSPGPVQHNIVPTVGVQPSAAQDDSRMPVILAGGLTPENVAEAVGKVRPWGVDVSGGVELADGSGKDAEKVKAFVLATKK
jgi:anthranilate synthase/indole-3-glycerol phosphate synthase/phosphoribosylanthranilate isomerase